MSANLQAKVCRLDDASDSPCSKFACELEFFSALPSGKRWPSQASTSLRFREGAALFFSMWRRLCHMPVLSFVRQWQLPDFLQLPQLLTGTAAVLRSHQHSTEISLALLNIGSCASAFCGRTIWKLPSILRYFFPFFWNDRPKRFKI